MPKVADNYHNLDLIKEFRLNVKKLKSNKQTDKLICSNSKLSFVTYKKLISDKIGSLNINVATRVKLQDFNKKIANKYLVNIDESEDEKPLSDEELEEEMKKLGLSRGQYIKEKNPIFDYMTKGNEKRNKKKEPKEDPTAIPKQPDSLTDKTVGDPLTEEELEFYMKLAELAKLKPINCVITINLN